MAHYPRLMLLLITHYSLCADEDYDTTSDSVFSCYFCKHSNAKKDVESGDNQNPDCMNKLKFGSRTDLQRPCTANEPFCISTVTNMNGFFTRVSRDCVADCHEGCEERGYGLFIQECTRCCKTHLCNEFDGRSYYQPNTASSILSSFALASVLLTKI